MLQSSSSRSTDSGVGASPQCTIKDGETSSSNCHSEESSYEDETPMRYFAFSITSFRFLFILNFVYLNQS